jgi:hypothetical protein
MEIEFKNKPFVPFKDIAEGDTFLYHSRVCMKIDDITVSDDSKTITFNALYLDIGFPIALEPETNLIPIKMKLIEV